MTTPQTLPADGKTFVLQPGASPVMLTEYAFDGCLVINTAAAGLVWLGRSSAVASNSGVPLEPSTSAKWTQSGQLWAMLDPAATAAVTLVLTDRVDDWQQDPTVIAEITAQQLLATGIPPVLVEGNLTKNTTGNKQDTLTVGGGFVTYDVSKYTAACVNIVRSNNGGNLGYSVLAALDQANNFWLTTMGRAAGSYTPGSFDGVSFWFPTAGPHLNLQASAGGPVSVTVWGSNRSVARLRGGAPDTPRDFALSSTAFTTGQNYSLPATDGGLDYSQGPFLASVSLVTGAVAGWFGYSYCKPNGTVGTVFPFGTTYLGANARQTINDVAIPAAGIQWLFQPAATGTGTAELVVTPAT